MKLAFLTLKNRSAWVIDDDLAIAALAKRGVMVDEVPWTEPPADWRPYAAVVIRTPWDYQDDWPGFQRLLVTIEAAGVPLANPLPIVRWNGHKGYMRDLEALGVPVVPTQFGAGLDVPGVANLATAFKGCGCVVKPVVGAAGFDTFRLKPLSSPSAEKPVTGQDLPTIAAAFANGREWMAQPFIESILTEGEYSLFYFHGVFSHAIRKTPQPGEFRVQEERGGTIRRHDVDAELRAAGDRAIATIPAAAGLPVSAAPLLQVRADFVRLANGQLAIMELELIEPSLYFRMHPDAPENFASAVVGWLSQVARR